MAADSYYGFRSVKVSGDQSKADLETEEYYTAGDIISYPHLVPSLEELVSGLLFLAKLTSY